MRCAIFLAMVLVILETPHPVPGQTPNEPAATGQDVKKHSSSKQTPSPASLVQNSTATQKNQNPSNPPAKANAQETVVVRELPTVTVYTKPDWWNRTYVILTGLLVLIGAVGVCFALRTLRAIESQTYILSESQRPRIVVEAGEHPSKTLSEDPQTPRVVLKIINKGRMPATGYVYESWIEVLPDTSGDFTAYADHHKCEVVSVLYPDTPQKINIPLRQGISDQDWPLVRKLEKHVCVRLYAEWADPFIPTRRCYADFGVHILPSAFGFLDKHNGVGYRDKKS
jgi:hypothetical protein